jgi:hypothetical protein
MAEPTPLYTLFTPKRIDHLAEGRDQGKGRKITPKSSLSVCTSVYGSWGKKDIGGKVIVYMCHAAL